MKKKEARLEAVYRYIKERIESGQGVPTGREIARDCKLSRTTVQNDLSLLEARGRIIRTPYQSRGIRLVGEGESEADNEAAESVYDYLLEKIEEGIYPTQKEVADACFLSRGAVRQALLWLEAQGRIVRETGQRNIRLPD